MLLLELGCLELAMGFVVQLSAQIVLYKYPSLKQSIPYAELQGLQLNDYNTHSHQDTHNMCMENW